MQKPKSTHGLILTANIDERHVLIQIYIRRKNRIIFSDSMFIFYFLESQFIIIVT